MELTARQSELLDTAQRSAGRAVLEFLPRSPTPAVLLELGWATWSSLHRVEMARLLARVSCSDNEITQIIVDGMSRSSNTWIHVAAEEVAPWINEDALTSKAQWTSSIQQMKHAVVEAEFDRMRLEAQTHHNLRSYQPTWWVQTGEVGYNRTLLKCGLSQATSKAIGRLLVGGQGLRGGDPEDVPQATPWMCCLNCLRGGIKTPETLRHIAFECSAYDECRKGIAKIIHENGGGIFSICRNNWSWTEIRKITRFFYEVLRIRDKQWAVPIKSAVEKLIQEEVDSLWQE